tara:strand:+ start:181 stop:465 length:285 start_codon:yes stop_codon:yes gene_type:complete
MQTYGNDVPQQYIDQVLDLHQQATGHREDILVNEIRSVLIAHVRDDKVVQATVQCDDGRKVVVNCASVDAFSVNYSDVIRWDIKASHTLTADGC